MRRKERKKETLSLEMMGRDSLNSSHVFFFFTISNSLDSTYLFFRTEEKRCVKKQKQQNETKRTVNDVWHRIVLKDQRIPTILGKHSKSFWNEKDSHTHMLNILRSDFHEAFRHVTRRNLKSRSIEEIGFLSVRKYDRLLINNSRTYLSSWYEDSSHVSMSDEIRFCEKMLALKREIFRLNVMKSSS